MDRAKLRYPVLMSVLAALTTLVLKATAYFLTDSVGLLSDALESLVNLLAALTALAALWYAHLPADSTHTYGHEKIEYFSSGIEGLLIFLTALAIFWYAAQRLITPRRPEELGVGMALAVVAGLINLAVGRLLLRVGRAYGSILLEADGKHLLTDVLTTVGVLCGLTLVELTGWVFFDPLSALAVAAGILWTSIDLLRRSFDGLMDHSLPKAEQDLVRAAISANLGPGMSFHALRTRKAGMHRFADFHLLVPGSWTVKHAHDLGGKIEEAIAAVLPDIEVTIHIEPIEEQTSWEDSVLLDIERQQK